MIVNSSHLSWCLNIYPGESWADTYRNVISNSPQVHNHLKGNPLSASYAADGLGLGMRLSATAVNEMQGQVENFKNELNELGLYVFTLNCFPYGNFHKKPVKEKVYYPDWSTDERVDYTVKAAEVLAQLIQKSSYGSISTVPVTYGKKLPDNAVSNLIKTAKEMQRIENETGKVIKIALEPEPDCYLERTDEAIEFYNILRNENKELTERYLGICLDTCHMALQFEKPVDSLNRLIEAGVSVPKIQISSVFSFDRDRYSPEVLKEYNEEVYLHQTLVSDQGKITQFPDLGDALEADPSGEWRIHYHVPLHFSTNKAGVNSTSQLLDSEFMKRAFEVCEHLETETYTYSVLPNTEKDVNESIADEFLFVLNKLQ